MGNGGGGHTTRSDAYPPPPLWSPWEAGGAPGRATVPRSTSLACAGGTSPTHGRTLRRSSTLEALPLHDHCAGTKLLQ